MLLNGIRLADVTVSEHILLVSDLMSADEVFITSTTREVLPVSYIDQIGRKSLGRVAAMLQSAFTEYTRAYTSSHHSVLLAEGVEK